MILKLKTWKQSLFNGGDLRNLSIEDIAYKQVKVKMIFHHLEPDVCNIVSNSFRPLRGLLSLSSGERFSRKISGTKVTFLQLTT